MSISLIESNRASEKSLRSTVMSIAVHASVITLAVYATASAKEMVRLPVENEIPIYRPPPAKLSAPHSARSTSPARIPTAAAARVELPPISIPDLLPAIDSASGLAPESLFTIGRRSGGGGAATNGAVDSGAPFASNQVEKPALPRPGNRSPRYPSLLERSRVDGAVLAQFVVDTLGRADMSTFTILDSSNDLFSESVRARLGEWRFYPAEAGGRKVKQVVQLPLKFIAPSH